MEQAPIARRQPLQQATPRTQDVLSFAGGKAAQEGLTLRSAKLALCRRELAPTPHRAPDQLGALLGGEGLDPFGQAGPKRTTLFGGGGSKLSLPSLAPLRSLRLRPRHPFLGVRQLKRGQWRRCVRGWVRQAGEAERQRANAAAKSGGRSHGGFERCVGVGRQQHVQWLTTASTPHAASPYGADGHAGQGTDGWAPVAPAIGGAMDAPARGQR